MVILNELDDYSLLLIFELLNLKDLKLCSLVCRRFNKLIDKINIKKLTLFFGTSPNLIKNQCCSKYVKSASKHKITAFDPILIYNNKLLSLKNCNLLKNVEVFIFNSNNCYLQDNTFSLKLFSNLIHLEIHDYGFCEYLKHNYLNEQNFIHKSLEHLILKTVNMEQIINSMPNLNYLDISSMDLNNFDVDKFRYLDRKLKLKYLIIKNDSYDNHLNYSIIEFLVNNCSNSLEFIQFSIFNGEVKQLDLLLSKMLNLTEIKVYFDESINGLIPILKKHAHRLVNSNFRLSINNLRITSDFLQNLQPVYFEIYHIDFETIEQIVNDKRLILNKDEYFSRFKRLRIEDNDDLNLFNKNCVHLKNLKQVIIVQEESDQLINLDLLINILPIGIKNIHFLNNEKLVINQNIFNNLPIKLPYLQSLSLYTQILKSFDLKFISKLIYLNELNLEYAIVSNFNDIYMAIFKCKFLCNLAIDNFLDIKIDNKICNKLTKKMQLKAKLNRSLKILLTFNQETIICRDG